MTAARPFHLLTASLLAQTREACARAVADWVGQWHPNGAPPEGLTLEARASLTDDTGGWLIGDPDGVFAWAPRSSCHAVCRWLFADESALQSRIGRAVAQDALRQLLQALLPELDPAAPMARSPLPFQADEPGAPVVDLELCFDTRPWHATFRLPDARLPQITTPKAAVTPIRSTLHAQTVTLSADLGDVEIDLRTLNTLSQGDVIRFDTGLDQALTLRVNGQALSANGPRAHLGMLGGQRALEIVNPGKSS